LNLIELEFRNVLVDARHLAIQLREEVRLVLEVLDKESVVLSAKEVLGENKSFLFLQSFLDDVQFGTNTFYNVSILGIVRKKLTNFIGLNQLEGTLHGEGPFRTEMVDLDVSRTLDLDTLEVSVNDDITFILEGKLFGSSFDLSQRGQRIHLRRKDRHEPVIRKSFLKGLVVTHAQEEDLGGLPGSYHPVPRRADLKHVSVVFVGDVEEAVHRDVVQEQLTEGLRRTKVRRKITLESVDGSIGGDSPGSIVEIELDQRTIDLLENMSCGPIDLVSIALSLVSELEERNTDSLHGDLVDDDTSALTNDRVVEVGEDLVVGEHHQVLVDEFLTIVVLD